MLAPLGAASRNAVTTHRVTLRSSPRGPAIATDLPSRPGVPSVKVAIIGCRGCFAAWGGSGCGEGAPPALVERARLRSDPRPITEEGRPRYSALPLPRSLPS